MAKTVARRRVGALTLVTAALVLGAGCSVGGDEDSAQKAASSAPATEAQGRAKDPVGLLALAADPKLGPILTDEAGFTLYRNSEDTAQPPSSSCEGKCATLWPPVPAKGASLPPGIDSALMGSLKRADGVEQLTLAGVPVYRYAKDTAPGQVKGHGVGGIWFATPPEEGFPGLEDVLESITGGATDLPTDLPSGLSTDLPDLG
ncbi:hypothetical protein [Streptomyces sp. YS415]|uniref:hypothetical protein n=1 Tax=Streptomyces sp. YS415 TaxID=2944806 RepID=UPI0020205280|nr:hypothetical protein [Streptomyces sp. YS415]MCL7429402.1 hypothetical protein [Streptomyces sp. YS415]